MELDHLTFLGLEKWYCKEFENAGMIVLSRSFGHHMKVWAYRKSVVKLILALEAKMSRVASKDKLEDLTIMKHNAEYLLTFIDTSMADSLETAKIQFLKECEYKEKQLMTPPPSPKCPPKPQCPPKKCEPQCPPPKPQCPPKCPTPKCPPKPKCEPKCPPPKPKCPTPKCPPKPCDPCGDNSGDFMDPVLGFLNPF